MSRKKKKKAVSPKSAYVPPEVTAIQNSPAYKKKKDGDPEPMYEDDYKFYLKWSWVRQRGKGFYIFVWGLMYSLLLVLATLISSVMMLRKSPEDWTELLENFWAKIVEIMAGNIVVYLIALVIGMGIAAGFWYVKEGKYRRVIQDTDPRSLPYTPAREGRVPRRLY